MKKGRAYQLTGQIGEYLIASELGRRGYICTTFTQNIPDFDILAIKEYLNRTIPIQVKTIRRGGGWQTTASNWMKIEFDGEYQNIKGKTNIENPNLIYVLVELGDEYGQDKFFLLRKKQLQQLYITNYRNWLAKHGGKKPKKPESLHCSIRSDVVKRFQNNWKILKEKNSLLKS